MIREKRWKDDFCPLCGSELRETGEVVKGSEVTYEEMGLFCRVYDDYDRGDGSPNNFKVICCPNFRWWNSGHLRVARKCEE